LSLNEKSINLKKIETINVIFGFFLIQG